MINPLKQMKKRGTEKKMLEFQKRAIATLTTGGKPNAIPPGMRKIIRDKFLCRCLEGHISRCGSAIKPKYFSPLEKRKCSSYKNRSSRSSSSSSSSCSSSSSSSSSDNSSNSKDCDFRYSLECLFLD